jgi:selenocysteine lyase/cysteine desulfurase
MLDIDSLRRTEFPWTLSGDSIYLNNASTGPLPSRAAAVLNEWAQLRTNPARITQERQFGELTRGRELIARLIGCTAAEIALATNTSYGINLAAWSLPLEPGDVVLAPNGEFPANVYPWMQAAVVRGIEYRRLSLDGRPMTAERVRAELDADPKIRVVALSWVGFATGVRVDLESIGRVCRERRVYFVVDAIQGLGPLTLDVRATGADIVACGCQKWLLSPWGAGFVYVRSELVHQLAPTDVSWMGVRGSDDFNKLLDYDLTWREDARRFEFVTLPFQDMAAMNASLDLVLALGADQVSRRALGLAQRIVDWAAASDAVELVTPDSAAERAAIISIRPHREDAALVSERLRGAGIAHSLREGAIRLSPHFYNTEQELDAAFAAITPVR